MNLAQIATSGPVHILLVAVTFIVIITVLVAAHELGHYLFARLFRMGVKEFAIGFGRPVIWTWRRSKQTLDDGTELETEFNIRAWPLGGFVRVLGMEPEEDGSEVKVINGFYSRPAYQRFLMLLAGPVFSVLAGLLLLAPVYAFTGTYRDSSKIVALDKSYGAGAAGVKLGDVVRKVDGISVESGYDVRRMVRDHLQGSMTLEVLRDGKPLTFQVTPKIDSAPTPLINEYGRPYGESRRQAKLGVAFDPEKVSLSPGAAIAESFAETRDSALTVVGLFTQPSQAKESAGSVVSMVRATSMAVSDSVATTVHLAAVLSISIGLFNLLPIPPLDGGQMLIAILEMLRGNRRVSLKTQAALINSGTVLLLLLFVSVVVLDIRRLKPEPKPSTLEFAQPGGAKTSSTEKTNNAGSNAPAGNAPASNSSSASNAPVSTPNNAPATASP